MQVMPWNLTGKVHKCTSRLDERKAEMKPLARYPHWNCLSQSHFFRSGEKMQKLSTEMNRVSRVQKVCLLQKHLILLAYIHVTTAEFNLTKCQHDINRDKKSGKNEECFSHKETLESSSA